MAIIADVDIFPTPVAGVDRQFKGWGGAGEALFKVTNRAGIVFTHSHTILERITLSVILLYDSFSLKLNQ